MCWNLPKQTKLKKYEIGGSIYQNCAMKRVFFGLGVQTILLIWVESISNNSFKLLVSMERAFQG